MYNNHLEDITLQWCIQDFPWGGGVFGGGGRGRGPPTQVLFSENICENVRIGSRRGGGRAPENFVCRSANALGHK